MSETEAESGASGSRLEEIDTRQRLWIFVAVLVLTFVVVLAVALL